VAEIGSNWEGKIEKAFRLIQECKDAGANAIKFQMWRQKDLYPDNPEFRKYELTFDKAKRIGGYCDAEDIEFFCSVFYPEAVAFLEEWGVERYKIASRTFKHEDPYTVETLEAVSKTYKPIIFSDGFHQVIDIKETERQSQLYCISEYPTSPDVIDWTEIMKYDGFSDHTLGIESALKYCKLKPDGILEKHVKLEDSQGPDAFFSITTQELATLITRLTISSDIPG